MCANRYRKVNLKLQVEVGKRTLKFLLNIALGTQSCTLYLSFKVAKCIKVAHVTKVADKWPIPMHFYITF